MLNVFRQDPSALLDYKIQWDSYLEEGDTINASTWTISPSGLTLSSPSFTDTTTTTWITGGTAGKKYEVTNHITTEGGRVDERSFVIAGGQFVMDRWRQFLDSLASMGGTVFLLFVLTQISFVMAIYHTPKAEEVMYLCVGGLLGVLKGESGKKPE